MGLEKCYLEMVWFIGFGFLDHEIFKFKDERFLLSQHISQQKSNFKLKYLTILTSKPYKLYHFQKVLFKVFLSSLNLKRSFFWIADDVIKKMADFGPFWVILGDINYEILQMTPFSSSTFHDLSAKNSQNSLLSNF